MCETDDMSSRGVFRAIEHLAATSSKNEKEALIAEYGKEHLFKEVLVAALNPFITYGIANLDEPVRTDGGHSFTGETWNLLDDLATRKLTGNAARDAVAEHISKLDGESATLLQRIIKKDLRAGFSESTVNKAIPGLVPTFDCMLAYKFSDHKHKLTFPLYAEPKYDGVRVLTFVNTYADTVHFYSRSGKEFTTFEHLKEPVLRVAKKYLETLSEQAQAEYASIVLDAEVVSGKFNKTVSDVRKKSDQATDATLYVFDLLPEKTFRTEAKGGCPKAGDYKTRRSRLEAFAGLKKDSDPLILVPSIKVNSEAEVDALYADARSRGLEGLIIKSSDGLYHRRRNHAWTRIKAEDSVDVKVTGAEEGTGKYRGMLGALIVDFKGVSVNVGTGLSDQQRYSFWDAFQKDEQNLIGRLIEVQYHEVTPDGSLRHPRFIRFRDDKDVE
ncbi:hypothetical protein LJC19_04740 [Oxalobacter sp. OttesenSCG-928-P03]|nr:hypothetical protein [Oxalobacter sp. OttesenSCG-928-P03]